MSTQPTSPKPNKTKAMSYHDEIHLIAFYFSYLYNIKIVLLNISTYYHCQDNLYIEPFTFNAKINRKHTIPKLWIGVRVCQISFSTSYIPHALIYVKANNKSTTMSRITNFNISIKKKLLVFVFSLTFFVAT